MSFQTFYAKIMELLKSHHPYMNIVFIAWQTYNYFNGHFSTEFIRRVRNIETVYNFVLKLLENLQRNMLITSYFVI